MAANNSSSADKMESPSLLATLTTLIPSSSSLLPLLASQRPLTRPSTLSPNEVHRFLSKLNGHVMSRDSTVKALNGRKDSWRIAKEILDMDEEGFVVGAYGKAWVTGLMPLVNTPNLPPTHLQPLVALLTTLFQISPSYPTFSRETALPLIPKYAQALVGIIARAEGDGHWEVIETVLAHIPHLLQLSPTPSRPLQPILTPILHRILLSPRSHSLLNFAAQTLATFHILPGKTSAAAAFKTDVHLAINEASYCLAVVSKDGWARKETAEVGGGGKVTRGVIALQGDEKAEDVVQCHLRALEGWMELIGSLMRYQTARPVAVPVGALVTLALKCLQISHTTPFVAYIDDAHRAKLVAILPKLWTLGMKLMSVLTMSLGDHLLPWLGATLEHSVYLVEELPKSALSARLAFLRFHNLMLSRLHVDASSATLHVRLLKHILSSVGALLNPTSSSARAMESSTSSTAGGGKKGKKRMRDVGEDSLVGGMEGKAGRGLNGMEAKIVMECFKLTAILHDHPSLPPHLLAYSMRLHLGLSATLNMRSGRAITQDPTYSRGIKAALEAVLDAAVRISGGSGTARPWTALIVSQDQSATLANTSILLHPSLPPLNRPMPAVSSLVFYNDKAEEDDALAAEMGFTRELTETRLDTLPAPTKRQRRSPSTESGTAPSAVPASHPVGNSASHTEAGGTVAPPAPVAPSAISDTSWPIPATTAIAAKEVSLQDSYMAEVTEAAVITTRSDFIWTPPSAVVPVTAQPATQIPATNPTEEAGSAKAYGQVPLYASDGEEIPAIDMGSSDEEDWNEGADAE